MKAHLILFVCLGAVVFTLLSASAYADMIYKLASPTNGYTVTGTITTDGLLGVLNASNVVSWSYEVVAPYNAPQKLDR
jgi:hypothetical protein